MSAGADARSDETTRKAALAAALVSSFLSPFMMSSTNIALPAMSADLRMDAVLMTFVPLAYVVPGAIFVLPFGRMADIWGRKKLFLWGMAFFSFSTIVCGFSTTGRVLIAARCLQGLGSAMIYGNGIAILMSVFAAAERGKVLGLALAAVYCGLSMGPPIGGFLTQQWGWRSIFFVSAFMGITITLWASAKLKGEWADGSKEYFDVFGSVVYCIALGVVLYGFRLLPAKEGFMGLGAGIACMAVFVKWEKHREFPLLDLRLFRYNRVFVLSNLAAFINYAATYAIGFLMSLYLQYTKHLNPRTAGLILIAQPVVQAVFSPYAGRLSDRRDPRNVASVGMACTVVGLILFAFLGEETPLWLVVGTLALHGLGFALFSSPNTNATMSSVDERLYGVASGVSQTMRLLGNSFSIGISMLIFSLYVGQVQITPDRYHAFLKSVGVVFSVFAVLCGCGIFASLAPGRKQ